MSEAQKLVVFFHESSRRKGKLWEDQQMNERKRVGIFLSI